MRRARRARAPCRWCRRPAAAPRRCSGRAPCPAAAASSDGPALPPRAACGLVRDVRARARARWGIRERRRVRGLEKTTQTIECNRCNCGVAENGSRQGARSRSGSCSRCMAWWGGGEGSGTFYCPFAS
jgi:hypothetical protein